MSGERPSPLHNSPEGVSGHWKRLQEEGRLSGNNKRENQKTEALPQGVSAPVAKQPELSKPGEQAGENPVVKHVDELKWQASLKGDPAPFQLNAAEQQAAERLGKPPPEKEGEVVETLDPEVEALIREAAMGDPAKEAHLLESAKKNRSLRDFFKHGPTSLTYDFPFPVQEQESQDTK